MDKILWNNLLLVYGTLWMSFIPFVTSQYPSCESCECHNLSDSTLGYIESPNYPDDYGNYLDICWILYTNRNQNRNTYYVQVEIVDFNTEACLDIVFVEEGNFERTNNTLVAFEGNNEASWCGRVATETRVSTDTGDAIFIRFMSDYSVTDQGFKIAYQRVREPDTNLDAERPVNTPDYVIRSRDDSSLILQIIGGIIGLIVFVGIVVGIAMCAHSIKTSHGYHPRFRTRSIPVVTPIGSASGRLQVARPRYVAGACDQFMMLNSGNNRYSGGQARESSYDMFLASTQVPPPPTYSSVVNNTDNNNGTNDSNNLDVEDYRGRNMFSPPPPYMPEDPGNNNSSSIDRNGRQSTAGSVRTPRQTAPLNTQYPRSAASNSGTNNNVNADNNSLAASVPGQIDDSQTQTSSV